ncbi:hypothetical protein [Luteitalea sp. TBR-22]|uniref:hypothetical protein n=1 Tax=Luteitalea sp. TBR-22 TaxID=2802971 RepID=UPI001EF73F22|nr:hypothetical protein [Luteitalea sp. TBR-22]
MEVSQQAEDDLLRQKAKELAQIFKKPIAADRGRAERPGFLERWMAAYLAELLERERRTTGASRTAVRAEIAELVPALWELQLARDALHVRAQVDWWERRVQEIDDETAALLRPLLENPQNINGISLELSDAVLGWLAHAEGLFRRYLLALSEAKKTAGTTASGREDEVVIVFGRRDEQMSDLSKPVLKLLPRLASVDPSNIAINRQILCNAMVNAIAARFALAAVLGDGSLQENRSKPEARATKGKQARKRSGARAK